MKKTIICNVSMQNITPAIYKSADLAIKSSSQHRRFAVNSYLEENAAQGDEYKVILIAVKDKNDTYVNNMNGFKEEFNSIIEKIGNIKVEIVEKVYDFSQERAIHQELMVGLSEEIEDNSTLLADVTYGPKNLPIIEFTILEFAKNYLDCEIDHIFYGKVNFSDGHLDADNGELCDLVSLFYLTAVTNLINVNDSKMAREAYKTLINM